eukprot:9485293-Pyramimonas_sp.AAC.1
MRLLEKCHRISEDVRILLGALRAPFEPQFLLLVTDGIGDPATRAHETYACREKAPAAPHSIPRGVMTVAASRHGRLALAAMVFATVAPRYWPTSLVARRAFWRLHSCGRRHNRTGLLRLSLQGLRRRLLRS